MKRVSIVGIAFVVLAVVANADIGRRVISQQIDPASYIGLWLLSAAIIAWFIYDVRRGEHTRNSVVGRQAEPMITWRLAGLAFLTIASAVFASRLLDIGTLALVMIAGVQGVLGLIAAPYRQIWQWAGVMMIFAGIGYLLAPGMYAPNTVGVLLGVISASAWATYWHQLQQDASYAGFLFMSSLRLSLLLVMPLLIFTLPGLHISVWGGGLAMLAGSLFVVGSVVFWREVPRLYHLLWQKMVWVVILVVLIGWVAWDQSSMMNMRLTSAAVVVIVGVLVIGGANGSSSPGSSG
ncbi:hypothetical protein [Salinivibrio sp. ES.052]|uniref:hypothetical protein n=1 Tax=Salinivibrio sp. ES.052 TaxID=1882823 RepID=UPI00092A3E80|nr:hypothetical protein [Salinivibrio sp. ES.052]SIN84732.1 hypothetical protein SAMN05444724_0850 [Salinivibrio sp. ES.052]